MTETKEKYFSISAIQLRSMILAVASPPGHWAKVGELGDEDAPEFSKIPGIGKMLDRVSAVVYCSYSSSTELTENGELSDILDRHSYGKVEKHHEKYFQSRYRLRHHLELAGFLERDRMAFEEKHRDAFNQLQALIDSDSAINTRYKKRMEAETRVAKQRARDKCEICVIL